MSAATDVDIDLESLLNEVLACECEGCDQQAQYRLLVRWSECPCRVVHHFCGPHAKNARWRMYMADLWECGRCHIVGAPGVVEVSTL